MERPPFAIVRIDQIHEIVAPTVEALLGPLGFVAQGPVTWVRSDDAPIRQLFCIQQWQGGKAAPGWGLSLDFVPHLSGNEVKWHRTLKSARPDIMIPAQDRSLDFYYCYGPELIAQTAPDIIVRAIEHAQVFWASAHSVAVLPQVFEQVQEKGLGIHYAHSRSRAHAFALAMNGLPDEAEVEYQRYLTHVPQRARDKLRALFVAAGGHGGGCPPAA